MSDTTTITMPAPDKIIVSVTALPDEVIVKINAEDDILTADQARELAALLVSAADRSAQLDWADGEGLEIIERDPGTASDA